MMVDGFFVNGWKFDENSRKNHDIGPVAHHLFTSVKLLKQSRQPPLPAARAIFPVSQNTLIQVGTG